jgi:hypothetical protein
MTLPLLYLYRETALTPYSGDSYKQDHQRRLYHRPRYPSAYGSQPLHSKRDLLYLVRYLSLSHK